MTTAVNVDASGQASIDTLLAGTKWAGTTLSYSFPTVVTQLADYADPMSENAFSPLSADQQLAIERALTQWARVADITFTRASDPASADIRIYGHADTLTAETIGFPSNLPEGGDIRIGQALWGHLTDGSGTWGGFTMLHELGHALGLKHPHDAIGEFPAAEPGTDSIITSIMSYASFPGSGYGGYLVQEGSYPYGPMLDDIAAILYLYGANWRYNAGDSVYTFDPGAPVLFETLWDGGGEDTYDFGNYTNDLKIDLRPGAWTDLGRQYAVLDYETGDDGPVPTRLAPGNIANAYLFDGDIRSLIENARGGAGKDTIIGNQADNVLAGNAGDDVLQGLAGDDTLEGGDGDDALDGGDGGDTLRGGMGKDTLTGGAGADVFLLTPGDDETDLITDFGTDDRLRIVGVAFAAAPTAGDGTDVLAGAVQLRTVDGITTLYVGQDDVAGADLQVALTGGYTVDNFTLVDGVLVFRPPPDPDPDPEVPTVPPPTTTHPVIDGVPVTVTLVHHADGSTTQRVDVPIVGPDRPDSIGNADTAEIALVGGAAAPWLSVALPVGVGLQATGGTAAVSPGAASNALIAQIQTLAGSDAHPLSAGVADTLADWSGGAGLIVQTLTPIVRGDAAPGMPLTVTAARDTALVIDARALPADTTLALNGAGLAVVVGTVHLAVSGTTTLWADAANQLITVGQGNVTVHAGDGADTVQFGDEARGDYTLRVEDGGLVVQSSTPDAPATRLYDVETLAFGDGAISLTDSEVGSLVRMYSSLFERAPDVDGINFWLAAYEYGVALADVANGFTGSPEFAAAFGGLDAPALVDRMYEVALGRPADAEGRAWHLAYLENGGSIGQMLLHFANSPEKIGLVGTIDSSIETTTAG